MSHARDVIVPEPSSSAPPASQNLPRGIAVPLHAQEMAVVGVIATQLVFLPWGLAGMRPWSQWIAFGLSAFGFLLSLLPRHYVNVGEQQASFRLYPLPRLLRFPFFWLGFALLAQILIQALNPAWEYRDDGVVWWIAKIACIEWLPAGVAVPFTQWGPWRMLVIYGSVWMAVCALWIGVTRRRSLQFLFVVLAANAFLLALFGLVQRVMKTDLMFFFWRPPANYFVASFTYKNHAGAYFNLAFTLCVGLALWYYERSRQRLEKSNPGSLFAFFATAVALIVVFSYSRTATVLLGALLLLFFTVFIAGYFKHAAAERSGVFTLPFMALGLIAFAAIAVMSVRTEKLFEQIDRTPEAYEADLERGRLPVARATWEMARDRLWLGWGAGNFRSAFPPYQARNPAIFTAGGKRVLWEHAHSDYLQLLAELGVLGLGLIAAAAGFGLWQLRATQALRNPFAFCVCAGLGAVAVHSIIDFNFYNPAILTTWWVLLFASVRWAELDPSATTNKAGSSRSSQS